MGFFVIRHATVIHYSAPVSEAVMEVRLQPRTEGPQRRLSFELELNPTARVFSYRDAMGNGVHHFNIPAAHDYQRLDVEATVEIGRVPAVPDMLPGRAWEDLDAQVESHEALRMRMPSHFAHTTPALEAFAGEIGAKRRDDPLSLLHDITAKIAERLEYAPRTTRVDSPIDEALSKRSGVCQDFAHIFIALCRRIGIPARYVSGYLYHRADYHDRSDPDATHAWAEAWLPDLGWVGFDPTNNLVAGERHIRVAVGRDYADVTPTRGVYKGDADSRVSVAVRVAAFDDPPADLHLEHVYGDPFEPEAILASESRQTSTEQQQQQQQQ